MLLRVFKIGHLIIARTMILCNLTYISLFEKIVARRISQILIPVAFNFTHSRLL